MESNDRQRSRSRPRFGFHDLENILHKRLADRGRFFEPEIPGNGCSEHILSD